MPAGSEHGWSEIGRQHEAKGPCGFPAEPSASASAPIGSLPGPGATAPCRLVRYRPKLSNSPFCTPPINACHSSGVNARTAPSGCLLLRTPTPPSARLATSTQLPFEKLSELLIQVRTEFALSEGFPCIGIPMSFTSLIVVNNPDARLRDVALTSPVAIANSKANRHHRSLGSHLPQLALRSGECHLYRRRTSAVNPAPTRQYPAKRRCRGRSGTKSQTSRRRIAGESSRNMPFTTA